MDEKKIKVGTNDCPEVYATFLQQVQSGKYEPIGRGNLGAVRIEVQREPSYNECNYVYSYR